MKYCQHENVRKFSLPSSMVSVVINWCRKCGSVRVGDNEWNEPDSVDSEIKNEKLQDEINDVTAKYDLARRRIVQLEFEVDVMSTRKETEQ